MRHLPLFLIAAGAAAGPPMADVVDARELAIRLEDRGFPAFPPAVAHELPRLPGYAWPARRNSGTTARRGWKRRVRSGTARNRPRR